MSDKIHAEGITQSALILHHLIGKRKSNILHLDVIVRDSSGRTTSRTWTKNGLNVDKEILKELNERQRRAMGYLLEYKKITSKEYQQLNSGITARTALRDLKYYDITAKFIRI